MPAHAGVNQGVRGDQAGFAIGRGEGHVLAFQAQPLPAGFEQRAQHFRPYRAIRHCQYLCVCIGQCQALDMRGALMVLVEQVQIGAGAVVDEQRLEASARDVPFQMLVIFEVLRRVFADVGVDVLRRLLAADAEALHQVIGGQAALPPGHCLDQAIAQGQIPAHGLD
ncbi:hypothetical protein D9M71_367420 [compost metagenome]